MGQHGGSDDGGTPPDMEALAKRYMDLWQKQVSAMASDPKLAEAMSRTMAFMTEAAKGAGAGMAPPPGGESGDEDADRPPSPGPADGAAGADLERMAERVDTLERRVAILEAALGGILARSQPD